MAERNLRGTWKVKAAKKIPKPSTLMVGMIYEGQDKFFGKKVIGVLVEMFDQNNEAILKTKDNKLISVDKQSLKIVLNG